VLLWCAVALQANTLFGQVVLSAYKPGDMVWVQDYHLMLLPSILKQTVPRMKVRKTP
jgi:trehalose-6-phosphate synthase